MFHQNTVNTYIILSVLYFILSWGREEDIYWKGVAIFLALENRVFIQKGVFIGNWTPIQAFMVPVIEHKAVFVLNTVTLLIPYIYVERKDCRAIFLTYRPIKFCFSLHAVFLVGKILH